MALPVPLHSKIFSSKSEGRNEIGGCSGSTSSHTSTFTSRFNDDDVVVGM